MRYRLVYLAISLVVIGIGIFSLVKWGLRLGVDFTGGSNLEYEFSQSISTEDATKEIENLGISVTSVQSTGENTYLFKLPYISQDDEENISNKLKEKIKTDITLLRFENVGPAIGPELIKKTICAIVISAGMILLWVAYQFKSIKFGTSAILAMFHDSLVLIGSFALLGHFWKAEIDFLFVTAMLTILSFSVHDTIVVYDRVRETQRKVGGNLKDLANKALTQTMVRSLNNSFTIIFMLTALILLGGTTVKWFAVALFVGTVSGTYSSPFVAVPLLVAWDEIEKKIKSIKTSKYKS
ncbi:MAG TPA: protein translocase subunit SecF [Patescibacteria group bacterium]|nr:protein translocase subunit SecF [Patescibacteria group bacterium]